MKTIEEKTKKYNYEPRIKIYEARILQIEKEFSPAILRFTDPENWILFHSGHGMEASHAQNVVDCHAYNIYRDRITSTEATLIQNHINRLLRNPQQCEVMTKESYNELCAEDSRVLDILINNYLFLEIEQSIDYSSDKYETYQQC